MCQATTRAGMDISRLRIASGGQTIDDGAARISEAHHFGDFVECFPGGVVARAAQQFVRAPRFRVDQFGMTAGNDQPQKRLLHRRIGQQRRQQMTFDMIDVRSTGLECIHPITSAVIRPTNNAPAKPGPTVTPSSASIFSSRI